MSELAKQNSAVTISIGRDVLTPGQKNIMALLSECMDKKRPVSREDVIEIWIRTQLPGGGYEQAQRRNQWDGYAWTWNNVTVDLRTEWDTTNRAMAWFKLNLGSCIVKGKILAIPIIEI